MKVIILTLSVFFAFLTFITSANAGDIYTYKDKDGIPSYQMSLFQKNIRRVKKMMDMK